MKIPWAKDGPEFLREVQGLIGTPLIKRYATMMIMMDGNKSTMVLVAVGHDDEPLGMEIIESIDHAKAFAEGLVRDAIGIYGTSKPKDDG